jgi:hypothetical protein
MLYAGTKLGGLQWRLPSFCHAVSATSDLATQGEESAPQEYEEEEAVRACAVVKRTSEVQRW